MTAQIRVSKRIVAGKRRGLVHEVCPDVAYQRLAIVNVAYIGSRGVDPWVLVDAGLPGTAGLIRRAARARFGSRAPAAILLTHGHFDHVGALATLAEGWDVPIYAHPDEIPFLAGRQSYSPPDPSVGGGLIARLSSLYPSKPIDVRLRLRELPKDSSVPHLPDWRWIPTPGHTPGHVSFWRASDKTLIAGDAVISTRQESAYAVAFQLPEVHGPPTYFTPDWRAAEKSVDQLEELEPELLVTGHGPALRGEAMRQALFTLSADFEKIAVPRNGRYVRQRLQTMG